MYRRLKHHANLGHHPVPVHAKPHMGVKRAHDGHGHKARSPREKPLPVTVHKRPAENFFTAMVTRLIAGVEHEFANKPAQFTPYEKQQIKIAATTDIHLEESRFAVVNRFKPIAQLFVRMAAFDTQIDKDRALVKAGEKLSETYKTGQRALYTENETELARLAKAVGITEKQLNEFRIYLKARPNLDHVQAAYAMDLFGAQENFTNKTSSALGRDQLLAGTAKDILKQDGHELAAEHPGDRRYAVLSLYGDILTAQQEGPKAIAEVKTELAAHGLSIDRCCKDSPE